MALFIFVALFVWASLNGYAIWRLGSLSALAPVPGWSLWAFGLVLWLSLPAAVLLRTAAPRLSGLLNVASTTWLGVVFLLCLCFLAADAVSLGGWAFKAHLQTLRLGAVGFAGLLILLALVQGHRDPVVRRAEVRLAGLPAERDGLKVLFVSDLHLGTQLGASWIKRLVVQAESLQPDLIAIGGDLIDNEAERVVPMIPELRTLKAPLGVWAVLGNHDVYSGPDRSAEIMEASGYRVLHDTSVEVLPGLRLAGVDDLGVRGGADIAGPVVKEALRDVKKGREGCIFLSHTPEGMEAAAEAGAGLMLSGHTHGGQLWPFGYLVQLRFPTLAGRFEFGPLTLMVSRGAGTWGPRMRLWQPGDLQLITLRAAKN